MMLNCKQASELMSQEMDTPLPLAKRIPLRLHLMMCDGCTGFLSQLRFLRMAAKRFGEKSERCLPHLSKEARERIAKVLRESQKNKPPAGD